MGQIQEEKEVRTMAKTINLKVTITDGKTIQTIWTGIPDFKMGEN